MCLDENDGSFVLMKMTGRVSFTKTPSCAWGLSLYFAEVGLFFLSYSWIIRGRERRVATASKKGREKREESPFSAATPIRFFFSCLLFPSFPCFCCLGSKSIHRSIENSRSPGGMCFSTQ